MKESSEDGGSDVDDNMSGCVDRGGDRQKRQGVAVDMRSMRAMDGCSTEGTGVGKTRVLMEKKHNDEGDDREARRERDNKHTFGGDNSENCAQCVKETKEEAAT